MTPALIWILIALEPVTLEMTHVARYATAAECEIGRMQYEMQYVVLTECRRDG